MDSKELWEQLITLEVATKATVVIPMSEIGNGDISGIHANQDNY